MKNTEKFPTVIREEMLTKQHPPFYSKWTDDSYLVCIESEDNRFNRIFFPVSTEDYEKRSDTVNFYKYKLDQSNYILIVIGDTPQFAVGNLETQKILGTTTPFPLNLYCMSDLQENFEYYAELFQKAGFKVNEPTVTEDEKVVDFLGKLGNYGRGRGFATRIPGAFVKNKPSRLAEFSNETLDQAVLSAYPKARRVPTPEKFLDFKPVAHYIFSDFPGADQFGFVKEDFVTPLDLDDENADWDSQWNEYYKPMTVTFAHDHKTGRLFFWERDKFGNIKTVPQWHELSTGEFTDGELIFETGREYVHS